MKRLIIGLVLALVLVGAAVAAPTPTNWTPAQARAELLSQTVTFRGATGSANITFDNAPIGSYGGRLQAATCRGLGPKKAGGYQVFSCGLTWFDAGASTPKVLTAWVRPWSSTVACVTDVSVGACPPAPPLRPLHGDPRVCASSLSMPYVHCILGAATAAANAQLHAENVIGVNYGCKATTAFVYRCSSGDGSHPLTVSFVAGKTSWSTRVA